MASGFGSKYANDKLPYSEFICVFCCWFCNDQAALFVQLGFWHVFFRKGEVLRSCWRCNDIGEIYCYSFIKECLHSCCATSQEGRGLECVKITWHRKECGVLVHEYGRFHFLFVIGTPSTFKYQWCILRNYVFRKKLLIVKAREPEPEGEGYWK